MAIRLFHVLLLVGFAGLCIARIPLRHDSRSSVTRILNSWRSRYASIQIGKRITNMVLLQKFSKAACTYRVSYGFSWKTAWVNKGCRGSFRIYYASTPGGTPGTRGPPGPSGTRGPPGRRGYPGPRGPKGLRGLKGVHGPVGPPGRMGPKGNRGSPGIPCRVGIGNKVAMCCMKRAMCTKGQKGHPGKSGRGITGRKGRAGTPGKPGYPGRIGRDGKKGEKGDKSDTAITHPKFGSCQELKSKYPSYESDMYRIKLPSGEFNVYCEMGINGGGYTFISRTMVSKLTPEDVSHLFKKRADVLLRISRPDGTQPYTVIKQYKNTGGLSVQVSEHGDNSAPMNKGLGPYILLGTYPASRAVREVKLGFYSNNIEVTYNNCDRSGKNLFAFFSNPNEKTISSAHPNLIYEKHGLAVNWRTSAIRPPSGSRIPLNYFHFTEMQYGGCGCYTSSDRWLNAVSPALGTAIGLR